MCAKSARALYSQRIQAHKATTTTTTTKRRHHHRHESTHTSLFYKKPTPTAAILSTRRNIDQVDQPISFWQVRYQPRHDHQDHPAALPLRKCRGMANILPDRKPRKLLSTKHQRRRRAANIHQQQQQQQQQQQRNEARLTFVLECASSTPIKRQPTTSTPIKPSRSAGMVLE